MKAADQISADLQRVLWAWSLLLVVGLLSLAAGVVVLAKPHISLATLAVVTGIFLLADGVLELVYALVRRGESRALPAVIGIVSVVGGVILVRHPTKAVAVIALLLWYLAHHHRPDSRGPGGRPAGPPRLVNPQRDG